MKKNIALLIDEELIKSFDEFAKNVGTNRSTLINMFIKYCVDNRRLPFVVGEPKKDAERRHTYTYNDTPILMD